MNAIRESATWLPTTEASQLGCTAQILKGKRDIYRGFLENVVRYFFGHSLNSPMTWDVELIEA